MQGRSIVLVESVAVHQLIRLTVNIRHGYSHITNTYLADWAHNQITVNYYICLFGS